MRVTYTLFALPYDVSAGTRLADLTSNTTQPNLNNQLYNSDQLLLLSAFTEQLIYR